jgi:peptidylprolyl isomerase
MAQAKQGDMVRIHYTGRLDDGTVFDSSVDREPLEFQLGARQVIKGFDAAVIGMDIKESKTVTIPSDEAYGPHRKEMVMGVPRDQFPEHIQPEIGQQLQLQQQDGNVFVVTITNVEADQVTLDANHPLAGKTLIFDIELVEIMS